MPPKPRLPPSLRPYTTTTKPPTRLTIALTGATGAPYGITTLKFLRELNIESRLIISQWAHSTIKYETPFSIPDVTALATKTYSSDGMIIAPCSVNTLAAIRAGYAEDLISRAADVCIKERRPLVLVVRETPLSAIYLENMLALVRLGGVVFPAVPAFYTRPKGLEAMVEHSVARMLDCVGVDVGGLMPEEGRWEGYRRKQLGYNGTSSS
ncbi:Phenylacrylic acid decarboxylase [Aspergillus ellipticus CBS 707.79]|uniref:Flavin prenyltransferase PAD1, mitochondrial n=1 Tax=Aspergillus ellipticus CBS 707.79 TaxID=1448320 RepID=A0A319DS09_9EURO|nr:Phenylacrylic acid decarboxylase [Aspergillus ellipticus CBS 707.79]